MRPARALSADVGSKIFANHEGSITCVGVKLEDKPLADKVDEDLLFPLNTLWNKQKCHWPIENAMAMFGFNVAT